MYTKPKQKKEIITKGLNFLSNHMNHYKDIF